MKFEIRTVGDKTVIVFHDVRPGSHATMFANNGQRLPFRDDVSHFSDAKGEYAWAFEGEARVGDVVVFATADREVVGRVVDEDGGVHIKIQPANRSDVARNESDKPVELAGALLPPVSALLEPPHPKGRPRPIALPRPK
jgi:hypothetical protein